jgi:hypothetical protein
MATIIPIGRRMQRMSDTQKNYRTVEMPDHMLEALRTAKMDERHRHLDVLMYPDWQPIETAPKDGSDFLAFIANGRLAVARYVAGHHFAADSLGSGETTPTHWMSLPEPPVSVPKMSHPADCT